jgi:preprotein translocase subunit SecD
MGVESDEEFRDFMRGRWSAMVRLAYTLAGDQGHDAALDSTAIVLDGNVQSAPVTEGPITNGKLMIAGPQPTGFTHAEAEALAVQLSTTAQS